MAFGCIYAIDSEPGRRDADAITLSVMLLTAFRRGDLGRKLYVEPKARSNK